MADEVLKSEKLMITLGDYVGTGSSIQLDDYKDDLTTDTISDVMETILERNAYLTKNEYPVSFVKSVKARKTYEKDFI